MITEYSPSCDYVEANLLKSGLEGDCGKMSFFSDCKLTIFSFALIFHCFVRYDPSIDSHGEGVTVREMDNPNHPERNVIISMSDLHLDSIWSENENERIQTFMKDLVELAKVS